MGIGNGDAGPGRALHKHKCPVCGQDKFAHGPAHFLGEPVDPSEERRMAVMPFVCANCKAITLVLSPEQPLAQSTDEPANK